MEWSLNHEVQECFFLHPSPWTFFQDESLITCWSSETQSICAWYHHGKVSKRRWINSDEKQKVENKWRNHQNIQRPELDWPCCTLTWSLWVWMAFNVEYRLLRTEAQRGHDSLDLISSLPVSGKSWGLAGERQETLEENLSEIFRRKGGKHVKYVSLKWAELSQTKRILCGRVRLFLCFFGLWWDPSKLE